MGEDFEVLSAMLDGQPIEASIGIRATPSRQDGRQGDTWVGDEMLAGDTSRLNVTAGQRGSLCTSGVWMSKNRLAPPSALAAEMERAAPYIWRFDVSVIEVMTARINFDLEWLRTSRLSWDLWLRKGGAEHPDSQDAHKPSR